MISRDGDNVGGREQPLVGVQVSGGHYSPEEPECPMTTEKAGGARTRLLLLLLSLAAVAGAYYFTGSESSPPMPTQAPPVASFPAPSSKPNGTSVPLPTPAAPDAKMSVATSSPVGIVKKITPLPNRLSIAPPPKPLSPAAVSGDTAPS